jgi:hypothetical protein
MEERTIRRNEAVLIETRATSRDSRLFNDRKLVFISKRLDLPIPAPSAVKLRARVISRSLEVHADGISPECVYHLASPNGLLTPFFELRVPGAEFRAGEHAVLFEIYDFDQRNERLFAWAMFPLCGISTGEYRIQFSSCDSSLSLLQLFHAGQYKARKYGAYIHFEVKHLEDENMAVAGGPGRPPINDPAFRLLTVVETACRETSPSIVRWSYIQPFLGILAGDRIYVYSTIEAGIAAQLEVPMGVVDMGWKDNMLYICFSHSEVWCWDVVEGQVSKLDIPYAVQIIRAFTEVGLIGLFGDHKVSLIAPDNKITFLESRELSDVLDAYEANGKILAATRYKLIEIFDGTEWCFRVISSLENVFRFSSGCFAGVSGKIFRLGKEGHLRLLATFEEKITAISVSGDGVFVAVGDTHGHIHVLSLETGEIIFQSECLFPNAVGCLDWSCCHKMLSATCQEDSGPVVPAVILLPRNEVGPLLSPTLYEWTSAWINKQTAASIICDVSSLKKDILARSLGANID